MAKVGDESESQGGEEEERGEGQPGGPQEGQQEGRPGGGAALGAGEGGQAVGSVDQLYSRDQSF